ncbi:MAG: hypothetical protein LBB72_00170 [Spirochaetaceae bacterium]|jgi:predicted transposase YdaD|nr:hypothetical protein [Spirochaetaceae bacterium]
MNMLMTEWNWDDALAVRYEEGMEDGIEKGLAIAAQKAIGKGLSVEMIHDITGLDLETIQRLNR